MYSPLFTQSNLNNFNEFTNSYTSLMFMLIQHNLEQAEVLRERFLEAIQATTASKEASETDKDEQLLVQEKELEALKLQIEELNRKYAVLENRTRSGRWNKTGSGHFKRT